MQQFGGASSSVSSVSSDVDLRRNYAPLTKQEHSCIDWVGSLKSEDQEASQSLVKGLVVCKMHS